MGFTIFLFLFITALWLVWHFNLKKVYALYFSGKSSSVVKVMIKALKNNSVSCQHYPESHIAYEKYVVTETTTAKIKVEYVVGENLKIKLWKGQVPVILSSLEKYALKCAIVEWSNTLYVDQEK